MYGIGEYHSIPILNTNEDGMPTKDSRVHKKIDAISVGLDRQCEHNLNQNHISLSVRAADVTGGYHGYFGLIGGYDDGLREGQTTGYGTHISLATHARRYCSRYVVPCRCAVNVP